MSNGKTVALLVGGWSVERQVSLDKSHGVYDALKAQGYDVRRIDVQKDIPTLIEALTPKPDVVFNNLYGRGGEDGEIQALLEMLEIPYTHSGVLASAVGMDKPLSKVIAKAAGVPVAEEVVCTVSELLEGAPLDPPYVVKPTNEGSSVGIRIILDRENQPPVDLQEGMADTKIMVERYIPGRELTVALLDGQAQAVTEIVSKTRFFDYEAKYKDTQTEYILPAKLDEDVYKACLDYAERVYNGIGAAGIARCDFRYDDSKPGVEGLYFLEINTQPGFTAESIGPSQIIYNGMSYEALCSHLVETAQCQNVNPEQSREQNDAIKEKTQVA